VPAAVSDTFLNILVELRGDFITRVSTAMSYRISYILYPRDLRSRYKFETIDAGLLRSHPLDAPVLVDLSSGQVVAFRKSASTIADEYLQQNDVRLSRSRLKPVKIRDTSAYAQGASYSRKIDVRQGRLQGKN
jgi:hypothetical protein